jgi:hypothetical protein
MNGYRFEFNHPRDGRLTLAGQQGAVVLSCHWPFDLDSDDWIDIHNRFPVEDYARAVDSALLNGEGLVRGIDGGFLKVTRRGSFFTLEFSNTAEGWAAKSLEVSIDRPLRELLPPQG